LLKTLPTRKVLYEDSPVFALALSLTLCAFAAQAQSTAAAPAKTTKKNGCEALLKSLTDHSQWIGWMKLEGIEAQQQQIKQLSDQVQSRDQQIQQLQQKVDQNQAAATDAAGKADSAASAAAKQGDDVTALKSDVSDLKLNSTNAAVSMQETQKVIGAEKADIKALSNLKFSGDLRLRYEPFFGGGPANGTATPDRNRERYRLRFNVNTKVDNDFAVGSPWPQAISAIPSPPTQPTPASTRANPSPSTRRSVCITRTNSGRSA
jgi:Spy/CpxP family protein refolding chaperone